MDRRTDDVPSAEMLTGLRSRSDFLKLLGGVGIGAAVGSNVLLRDAFGAVDGSTLQPTDLRFEITSRYRPFGVISPKFFLHRDDFSRRRDYEILAPAPESNPGDASVNGGHLQVSDTSTFFALFKTSKSPLAPYASVIVNVEEFAGAATEDTVYAGLIKDDQNYVVAWYNNATKRAGIDVVENGVLTRLDDQPADLSAPFRFAFVLNSKEVSALADTARGGEGDNVGYPWKPLANFPQQSAQFPDPAIAPGLSGYFGDLRDPDVLAQFKYGFGARASSGTIVLDGVQAGYWGRAGVRDPHVVTWKDGTPYIKNNKLYLTLTNAGLDFFATAHWGVYTIDLSNYTPPRALEEVGKIFFRREDEDDQREKVFGDHAGHIVYDGGADRFLVGVSTWGDFDYDGVEIRYTWTSKNVLRGVHVLETQKLNVPTNEPTDTGTWDPHFVRISGEWYVAFVDSPTQGNPWKHFPALAKGPNLEKLTLVGAESDLQQTEGMIMQRFGGEWYVLCSSGRGEIVDEDAGPATYRIYLPESDGAGGLEFFGELRAPYPTNIPHPMVTPLPSNGNTKWVMFTFDGTMYYEPILGYGTHGDFYVMDGRPITEGYEFPPRSP
jgi:hypothetical protein